MPFHISLAGIYYNLSLIIFILNILIAYTLKHSAKDLSWLTTYCAERVVLCFQGLHRI